MPRSLEDSIAVGGFHLEGIAEGGVETNLRVPEFKLIFDIGMCPPGALRFNHLLVSHGHNDHLGGLHYFLSQRGMMHLPPAHVHLPSEIHEPVSRMLATWAEIEGFANKVEFHPASPGESRKVGRDLTATPIRTTHRIPSLAWLIERTTRRLDDAYRGLSGAEIGALRQAGHQVTHDVTTPVLCVTGDTTIDTFLADERLRRCQVLVHECTAWDQQRDVASTRSYGHTHVDEWIEHVEKFEGETLVLVHRSTRHSRAFAEKVVAEQFPASVRDKVVVFGND
jgi:ribonuclease Z